MQLKRLSFAIGRALVGAGAVLCATLPLAGSGQQAASGYTVPRTAWGDPDLAGKWPGTDMVGVPMQRDEKLGLRNELTTKNSRNASAAPLGTEEQDNADFELENAASTPGGDVGGAVSLLRIGSSAASRSGKRR